MVFFQVMEQGKKVSQLLDLLRIVRNEESQEEESGSEKKKLGKMLVFAETKRAGKNWIGSQGSQLEHKPIICINSIHYSCYLRSLYLVLNGNLYSDFESSLKLVPISHIQQGTTCISYEYS